MNICASSPAEFVMLPCLNASTEGFSLLSDNYGSIALMPLAIQADNGRVVAFIWAGHGGGQCRADLWLNWVVSCSELERKTHFLTLGWLLGILLKAHLILPHCIFHIFLLVSLSLDLFPFCHCLYTHSFNFLSYYLSKKYLSDFSKEQRQEYCPLLTWILHRGQNNSGWF